MLDPSSNILDILQVAVPFVPYRFLPSFLIPLFASELLYGSSLSASRSLALWMLRDGWATTYEQAGAVHEPWGLQKFKEVEQQARLVFVDLYSSSQTDASVYSKRRRGQWKRAGRRESPTAYKERFRNYKSIRDIHTKASEQVPDGKGLFNAIRSWFWRS